MKTSEFFRKAPRNLPQSIRQSLEKSIVAAQLFGSASGRRASPEQCQARHADLVGAVEELFRNLEAELSKRYDAGIELGRSMESGDWKDQ